MLCADPMYCLISYCLISAPNDVARVRQIRPCGRFAVLLAAWVVVAALHTPAPAQVALSDLTDLQMVSYGTDFKHIRIPSTAQLLTRIAPSVWQGNADIYPVDPRITSPGDVRRAGHYWSQFLMSGIDPDTGEYFLTDRVESEGETLQAFNILQSTGKVIEYEGTWSFRDLFTTTAHHWVWVEGNDHYHRVQVSLDVLSPVDSAYAIWTELFNSTDAYGTVTASTRDDGIQTRSTLGTTNRHYLAEYELGRDNWIAFTNPQDGQAGSVARVLLSSQSDIRTDDEVNPVWADYSAFDNIELHLHHQTAGFDLQPGTHFFMDNLLITNPALDNTDWVDAKVDRGKEWIELIGPPISPPGPGEPVSRFFVPVGSSGNWDATTNWGPIGLPDSNDTAIINGGRTATIDSDVGSISVLRLGDGGTGTLNIAPGALLTMTDRGYVGLGSGSNSGTVSQTGGDVTVIGADPVIFLAYDTDDTANYTISDGKFSVGNLWFRFGVGTMTQTGGLVEATQLVLGESGGPSSQATYALQSGTMNVSGVANIGKAPGAGDPLANSHGTMLVSGGTATFGGLLFGVDATDFISISGDGLLRVLRSNYSEADALADIAAGNITGTNLWVSTVDLAGLAYTQINLPDGDYNGDGVVDAADYTVWRDTLGSESDLRADGNHNLVIDQGDYDTWKVSFASGMSRASAAQTAVPEPPSIVPMAVFCISVFLLRPRLSIGARDR